MLKITSSELQRQIGAQLDAAQRGPVVIASNGRERAVLISVEEFKRLKRRDRVAYHVTELTDDELGAMAASEPPAEALQFDHEVDGDLSREYSGTTAGHGR